MANEYAVQIKREVLEIRRKIEAKLRKLYEKAPVKCDEEWLLSDEFEVVEEVCDLADEYERIIKNMKTSFWGDNYWSPLINEYNSFIDDMGGFAGHFSKESECKGLFEGTAFGAIDQNLFSQIKQKRYEYVNRLEEVRNALNCANCLHAMKHGYPDLQYALWLKAESSGADEFIYHRDIYYRVTRFFNMDVFCAELYVYHLLNKNLMIKTIVGNYLNNKEMVKNQRDLDMLSSALAWMDRQEALKNVLVYMKKRSFNLTNARAAKLKELENRVFQETFEIASSNNDLNLAIYMMRSHMRSRFNPREVVVSKEKSPEFFSFLNDYTGIERINNSYKIKPQEKLTGAEMVRLYLMCNDAEEFDKRTCFVQSETLYLEGKQLNKKYYSEVTACHRVDIQNEIKWLNETLESPVDEIRWKRIWSYQVKELLKYAWYCAMMVKFDKTYSEDFKAVKRMFYRMVRFFDIHMFIAELEFIVNTQGKGLIEFQIDSYLKNDDLLKTQSDLDDLSVFLEYYDIHQEEKKVLQYMINHKMTLNSLQGQRLYYLNNHREDAPKNFEVQKERFSTTLHFDATSIEWRENEINEFFKELELLNKRLDYSLAVSLEDSDLVMSKGMKLAEYEKICRKLNHDFEEEYGEDEVKAVVTKAMILSDVNEEIEGLLVKIQECPTMNLLVHLMKIGKKLNIRFYILYTPQSSSTLTQKNQFHSMIKKVSPSLNVWEKSVKDTVLLSLQHILNESVSSVNQYGNSDEF